MEINQISLQVQKLDTQNINGKETTFISSIDFNYTTPLGFNKVPDLEVHSISGKNAKLKASLGVYSGWWYSKGMFYPTIDKFDSLDKNYNDKDIVSISNIGKPFINIFNNSGYGAKFFVNVADGGIGEYVLYSGSGYTNSDNIQFDYQKSNTSGKRARIINYVLSDSKIQKFNLWGGDNYVDDLVNGKSNTITLEYSHLKDRDNLDYNNMVIDYIDRGVESIRLNL